MGKRIARLMSAWVVIIGLCVWGAAVASSQTLSLDDQTADAVGNTVTFTVSLDNPATGADIGSLTFDVNFDSAVLTYVDHARGALVASWGFFDVNAASDGVLKVAGFNLQGIPADTSGEVVSLQFTVASMDDAMLTLVSADGFAVEPGEFTFELPPANNPPVAMDDMSTTVQGQSVVINVLGNDEDADGENLTVSAVTQGSDGTVAIGVNAGSVTYTPNAGFSGTDDFTYTVTDGTDTDSGTVTVTVMAPPPPANNAPVATDDEADTDEDMAVEIDVLANDTDADGDSLTVMDATAPGNGTAVVASDGSSITYTPDAGFSGEDQFMYTVSDGEDAATGTVYVTVEAAEVPEPMEPMEPEEPMEPMEPEDDDDTVSGGGGGGCTLNPNAPFSPTLILVLALFSAFHVARRVVTRRQPLS